jgi:hypothetical protein
MTTLDNVNKSGTKIPVPIFELTLKTARRPTRTYMDTPNKKPTRAKTNKGHPL